MWVPKVLIIKNFKSFIRQEFKFEKGAFLIQGLNKTDEGQASIGSGKSSFREAICYVLDLPTYANILTDLINNDAKRCEVEFHLYHTISKDTLSIIKSTPRKGSSKLVISINSDDQKDKFATVADGHKLIISLLGVSKEDLVNHYIISKEKYKSFFSSSDREVKELIGRFSNFDRVDGVEDYVEADVNELVGDEKLLNDQLNKLIGKVDLLKEQLEEEQYINIEDVKSVMVDEFEQAIALHQEKIQELNGNTLNVQASIKEYNNKLITEKAVLNTIEKEISKLKVISFNKEVKSLEEKKKGFKEQVAEVNNLSKDISTQLKEFNVFKLEVETAIEGSIKCPKCLHEFLPNNEMGIEEAKLILPQVVESISELKESLSNQEIKIKDFEGVIEEITQEIDSYEHQIDRFNKHKRDLNKQKTDSEDLIVKIERSISKANQSIDIISDQILVKSNLIEQAKLNILQVKKETVVTKEKEIKKSINEVAKEILIKEEEIQAKKDRGFGTEQWVHRFKKFKSSLANESLDIIGGYANMYLQKMRTDLNLKLEGYKTLKSGVIREKITPIVLRNGEQSGTGSFRKFSGGERAKIDFAISVLALQSLINNSSSTGGLNLLIVDETLGSLDSLGLENLVDGISDLGKYCYIVSHVTHEKVNNNVITIEKVNKISKIV